MSRAEPRRSISGAGSRLLIRSAQVPDIAVLSALAQELRRHEAMLYQRIAPASQLATSYVEELMAEAAAAEGILLVAEWHRGIAGYIFLRPRVIDEMPDHSQIHYAMVDDLVVTRALRGNGIGRRLLEAGEAQARKQGASWIRIGSLARNEAALALYKGAGFQDHLVILEKPLHQVSAQDGIGVARSQID
ncbi:ribosomal protein S18 acetylase RimI-like enzyme [Rhodoligotrophos appendicifer]|uniref:GNAT family N-acetyltransferase n=1 Tax=Rhodoligotrophos appendicifer TaxID=987056 RepID=UPI001478B7FB|nr:GNAT family N-acetyltransferase [Rhodoligotrophos appendicifer]